MWWQNAIMVFIGWLLAEVSNHAAEPEDEKPEDK